MQTTKRFAITLAGILLAFAAAPLLIASVHFQHLLVMLLLYTTLSQAWNLIGGYAGQVSFGHAVFFGIGAYAAMAPLNQWGLTPWVGMVIGAVISVMVALMIGVPVFRLKGHYFAISTFAVAEVVKELFSSWKWVDGPIGLDAPILEQGFYNLMFYKTKLPYLYITLGFFLVVMVLTFRMERSRMGYYFRAIKQRPDAAQAMGVNISLYKQYAFMISALFTAICGSFYAMYVLHIEPATVFFNCATGFLNATRGDIFFNGQNITRLGSHRICHLGICRTFQIVQSFNEMTVLENIMMGAFCRHAATRESTARAEQVLEITGLKDKRNQIAGSLTLADQKRIELARTIATQPTVMLLDEVMAGLNPTETDEAVELIRKIHAMGLTLIVVEHVMEVIMDISQRIAVFDSGELIVEGPPAKVVRDERVIKAYLGEDYHA